MKSEFMLAITQLSAEENLPKEVVLSAVETALVSAYRKDNFAPTQEISVKIDPTTGRVRVWAEKTVVEKPSDTRLVISLDDAAKINPDVKLEETVMVEATPRNAGRIAAQTAKQVILQRLHEAEHGSRGPIALIGSAPQADPTHRHQCRFGQRKKEHQEDQEANPDHESL